MKILELRKKRRLMFLLYLFLIFSFLSASCAPKEPATYKIGAILPLSGSGANYGKWEKQGVDLAVEEINQAGGINGKKVEIIFEDSKSLPKDGVSAMNKLATVNKVPVVIAGISSVVLACAPVADQYKVVLLNSGGVSPKIRGAGKYVFSNIGDGAVEVKIMAEYAYNYLKFKKLAVLFINAAAGTDSRDIFIKHFKSLGGEIVAVEGHDQGATDFRAQLTKLRDSKPDAIYLASFTKESALILKQASEMRIKAQWLSYAPFQGQDILTIAGKAAEGVIYTSPAFDPNSTDEKMREFQNKYEASYSVKSELYAATFYDGIKLIAEAIKKGGYSSEGIRKSLMDIKDYPGVSGATTFDADRAVSKPVILKTIKNGQFVLYSKDVFIPKY
jgi:branched-chain amino acid transport system substrate-binding protein